MDENKFESTQIKVFFEEGKLFPDDVELRELHATNCIAVRDGDAVLALRGPEAGGKTIYSTVRPQKKGFLGAFFKRSTEAEVSPVLAGIIGPNKIVPSKATSFKSVHSVDAELLAANPAAKRSAFQLDKIMRSTAVYDVRGAHAGYIRDIAAYGDLHKGVNKEYAAYKWMKYETDEGKRELLRYEACEKLLSGGSLSRDEIGLINDYIVTLTRRRDQEDRQRRYERDAARFARID